MAALSVTTAIGLQQFGGALRPAPFVASSVTYGGFYCKQQQQQQQQQSLFQVSTTIVGARFLRRKQLHERSSKKMGRALICAVAPVKEEEESSSSSSLSSSPAVKQSSGTSSSVDPLNVLVTGSTKGVGLALAREFLRFGDNVVICSRSVERVENTVQDLKKEFEEQKILGMACDVRDSKSIQALADMAKSKLGHIDIWINNAGTNAYTYKPLVEFTDADIMQIVETNTLGVMLCCRQAIRLMREQNRGGHIFNMDGAGADGNATPRFAAYGATKRSLAQFTKSLQAELKMQGIKKVVVHNLSPGMVTTDLLMTGGDTRVAKFFINALAEPADKVAQYLVPRIRLIASDRKSNSTYTRFLTGFKAYTKILARLLFKARKDRYLPED
ncbi:unnamed protein product [Sphagnum jensenii]|uniref:Chlorophyll b reductase n=1 Tax=Sphagnum jensenii TaxID=128206 RepID=A0ABP1AUW7_9BRYO